MIMTIIFLAAMDLSFEAYTFDVEALTLRAVESVGAKITECTGMH